MTINNVPNIIGGEIRANPLNQNFNWAYDSMTNLQAQITSNDDDIANRYTKSEVDSQVSGLQSQINTDVNNLATHIANPTNAHGSSAIVNQSSVVGANVSGALNTVQQQVNALVVGGTTNTTIGVYSLTTTGTANAYLGSFGGLTYFGGLKLNLTINATNTGASTFNLNSLGVKNIKLVNGLGVKQDLMGGELKLGNTYQVQYDGTDIVLLLETQTQTFNTMLLDSVTPVSVRDSYVGECETTISGRTDNNMLGTIGGFYTQGGTAGLAIGWTAGNVGTFSLSNGEQTFTPTSQYGNIGKVIDGYSNKLLFICGTIKTTDTTATCYLDGVLVNKQHSGSNYFEKIGSLSLFPGYASAYGALTTKTSAFVPITVKQAYVINVTDDYPELLTKGWTNQQILDWLLANTEYHDGMKSCNEIEILSSGKNQFNKNTVTTGYSISTTGTTTVDANYSASDYIYVKPSTAYYRTNTTNLAFYTINKVFISYVTTNSATTPSNAYYIRFSTLTTDLNTTMFNEGSTSVYEAYKSSILSVACNDVTKFDLAKLPNGIQNEINEVKGYISSVKNVSGQYSLQTVNINNLDTTSFINFDQISINTESLQNCKSVSVNNEQGFWYIQNYPNMGVFSDSISNINKSYAWLSGGSTLRITFPKGTYPNLSAAQTALTGTVIYYQLATPINIPFDQFDTYGIDIDGNLSSEPSYTNFYINSYKNSIPSSISIKYPIDIGASIETLKDGLNTVSEQLDEYDGIVDIVGTKKLKNWIINGGFDVWQRGTSQTTSGYGSDDRWANANGGSTTKTHSQQSFAVGQTDVPNNPTNFSRTIVASGLTTSSSCIKRQVIEDVRKLAGKTIILSFWAKADSSKNMSIEFIQSFGTGGSTSITGIGVEKFNLTNTWTRFTKTVNIPTISGKTVGVGSGLTLNLWFDAGSDFNARTNSLGNQSGTFDIANVSLVEGSIAQEWQTETFDEVLAQCQRYFEKSYNQADFAGTSVPGTETLIAYTTSTLTRFTFKTKKRIPPVITLYSRVGTINKVGLAANGADVGTSVTTGSNESGSTIPVDTGAGFTLNAVYSCHWVADAEL